MSDEHDSRHSGSVAGCVSLNHRRNSGSFRKRRAAAARSRGTSVPDCCQSSSDWRCGGAIQTVSVRVTIQASVAKRRTGRRIRRIEIPDARNAIASLSEDIRPKPVRMPTRTRHRHGDDQTLGR